MRSKNTHRIFILLTVLLMFIIGSVGAFAQGKGHGGNKHGGVREDRGNRGEKHRNRGDNRGGQKHQVREQRNDSWQGRGNGNERLQREQRHEQRSEQPRFEREQRQAWRHEQRRQDDRRVFEDRGRWQQIERGRNDDFRRQRRNDDFRQDRGWNTWNNYGRYRNHGQWRSDQVHRRNAERKAWKNEEKAIRRYERNFSRYSYLSPYDSYEYNRYVYQYPRHARANILRSFIVNYGDPYYPTAYTTRYDRPYPHNYRSYAAAPHYYVYQPSGYVYASQEDDPYYLDNYYDNVSIANYSDLIGAGFAQQVFSNLLAVGYEQGYVEGLNARRAGYSNTHYYDPYEYAGTNYLSSYSLGENRSCLSDGYELGYNDALYDRNSQDLYQNTNVDLVSTLIGTALQVL